MNRLIGVLNFISIITILFLSCQNSTTRSLQKNTAYATDQVTAFRLRSDFHVDLDEDRGWAADVNTTASQTIDLPFRIRFEVESDSSFYRRQYSLQYKWNDNPWTYVEAHEFPYESEKSPTVSIVSCDAFFMGENADNLLKISNKPSNSGAGIGLSPNTPGWFPDPKNGASAEWEFALVVRRWSDGPQLVKNGDQISLRMVDHLGRPLKGPRTEFSVNVPEGHLGGTFVETPARIGPYENKKGELYFIMEPTETDNIFMMLKSIDGGKSWFEVDAENRPQISDLEGVGSVMTDDGIIHIIHQVSDAVYHHAFSTADHTKNKDHWMIDSELIMKHDEPLTQTADICIRPDGSLVGVFAGGDQLFYSIYETQGKWSEAKKLSHNLKVGFTNPLLKNLPDGSIDFVYKSVDGRGWYRQLLPNNTLTTEQQFLSNLGTKDNENIAILPLAFMPSKNTTIAIFRQSDGFLYLSKKPMGKTWSKPIKISSKKVVAGVVDSDQTGADMLIWDDKIILSFISQDNRDIYFKVISDLNKIPEEKLLISDIDGSWLRGNILYKQKDQPVYGLIYDAGSQGGSGYNKYISINLNQ